MKPKMRYDKDALAAMCSKIDLLEYASETYDFSRKGNNGWACHCPRHIDKTASLYINPDRNFFHCFSCGVSGNIINWIMIFEHLSFPETIQKLISITGVEPTSSETSSAMVYYRTLYDIEQKNSSTDNEKIQSRQPLPRDFMAQFSSEFPEEWIEEGIAPDIMIKYGIRIDNSSNRIVYPLYDNDGNLISVKGRTRFKNYKDMGIPKYLPYGKLGVMDFFVGMKENRENILKKNEVIIFEGIKSGMKVEAWGYDNWVSSESCEMNEQQEKILIQMGIRNIIIAYDSDVNIDKVKSRTEILRRFSNVWMLWDKDKLLGGPEAKASPCDAGQEIFEELLRIKIRLR